MVKKRSRRSKSSKKVLPTLRKGVLSAYGYSTKKGERARRMALKKACKSEGCLPILRRVVVISNYNKNNPSTYKILRSDVEWLKIQYKKSL